MCRGSRVLPRQVLQNGRPRNASPCFGWSPSWKWPMLCSAAGAPNDMVTDMIASLLVWSALVDMAIIAVAKHTSHSSMSFLLLLNSKKVPSTVSLLCLRCHSIQRHSFLELLQIQMRQRHSMQQCSVAIAMTNKTVGYSRNCNVGAALGKNAASFNLIV